MYSLGKWFVTVQMRSTVDQPGQVQDCHQSKQEAHEEAIPKGFSPEDERHDHRHQHG